MDYRKMYLEQKLTSLQMEMQLLQNRFGNVQQQLKKTQSEYEALYGAPRVPKMPGMPDKSVEKTEPEVPGPGPVEEEAPVELVEEADEKDKCATEIEAEPEEM